MKARYGEDIFGKLFLRRVEHRIPSNQYLCLISDCGFQIEIDTVLDAFHPSDILLFRLHRHGKTFAGDTREYVVTDPRALPPVKVFDLYNESIKDLCHLAVSTTRLWLEENAL